MYIHKNAKIPQTLQYHVCRVLKSFVSFHNNCETCDTAVWISNSDQEPQEPQKLHVKKKYVFYTIYKPASILHIAVWKYKTEKSNISLQRYNGEKC